MMYTIAKKCKKGKCLENISNERRRDSAIFQLIKIVNVKQGGMYG